MNFSNSRIIHLAATLFVLSGCATPPQQLTAASQSNIRNVAVVSLVPESVNFDKVGIISFSSQTTTFNLGSAVTEGIVSVAQGRITRTHPDWNVKKITYDQAALRAKAGADGKTLSARAREAISALARDQGLDAVVVVRAAADPEESVTMQQSPNPLALREGLSVLLLDNSLLGDRELSFRANLTVSILDQHGEILTVGRVPSNPVSPVRHRAEDYGVRNDMKANHRPEILQKLGNEVLADLATRLNLAFDSLGFTDKTGAAEQHIPIAPLAPVAAEAPKNTAPQTGPDTDAFGQCFARCRQYTDRSKEQCFDTCNFAPAGLPAR
ncbi:hypothetical protein [Ferrigenium sp. UT5]|uniref:hypothetical protein n=1 Tax=Ferrigenium sp. UT5 TaxID=3242105 RepID=UPI00354E67A0